MSVITSASTVISKKVEMMAYAPVKTEDSETVGLSDSGEEDEDDRCDDGKNKCINKEKQSWITEPDPCGACYYTVWDSADDYNRIAAHVGGVAPTDCCTIYMSRIFWKCGGLCVLHPMGTAIKIRYEQVHNLKHQENPCWVWCCPEVLFRQVIREHKERYGTRHMQPAKVQCMSRDEMA